MHPILSTRFVELEREKISDFVSKLLKGSLSAVRAEINLSPACYYSYRPFDGELSGVVLVLFAGLPIVMRSLCC